LGHRLSGGGDDVTATGERRSLIRRHPFLAIFLVGLVGVWVVSALTWAVDAEGILQLHPLAQALQYLLVVLAATLAGLRLRIQPRELRQQTVLGFFDHRLAISDDTGGQAFWTAVGIGALVMGVNVAILVLADLAVTGGAAGAGSYLAWVGAGVAAGAVLGMLSAFLALFAALILRRRHRGDQPR
jgi:hypothetical protein